MNRRSVLTISIAAAVVVVLAAVAVVLLTTKPWVGKPDPAAATVPVALSADHVPADTKIGVILTLGQAEGSQWNQAAQGAVVAAQRLNMGGAHVTLQSADDQGTDDGGAAAVQKLAGQSVSGIVIASSGAHVQKEVSAAQQAGIPVVLPYQNQVWPASDYAYTTAPSQEKIGSAVEKALKDSKRTLLIDAGDGDVAGVPTANKLTFAPGGDTNALGKSVTDLTQPAPAPKEGEPTPAPKELNDAILVSGNASQQAAVVHVLQSVNTTIPVVLTPAATSPAFTQALQQAGGSASTSLRTVGQQFGDSLALDKSADGRGMSAFLNADRVLAADQNVKNLTGDQPFANVAAVADPRSHDAVVALVRAVSAAHDKAAGKVSTKLAGLKLSAADGTATGGLDFGNHNALDQDVVVLYATSESTGLRPAAPNATQQLSWFAGSGDN